MPPYDAGKFPNKWRKMWRDQPARTLMAHFGKDSYSHIHYDSDQARTISVREAARLQSFPDGFVFCGTMNPAGRQIGNAVPPLLAKALADNHTNDAASGVRNGISMSIEDRQRQFKEKIASHSGIRPDARVAENFGFSNSATRDRGRPLCLHEQPSDLLQKPGDDPHAPSRSSSFSAS